MFKTIIWASDGSETANTALPYAKELAGSEDATLIAVHCRELYTGLDAGYPVLTDDDELEAKIREQVVEACAEGIDATFTISTGPASGSAAHMIADLAREIGADAVVVGARGHGGPFAGPRVGSVTERLLHFAPCPVLTVPTGRNDAVEEPEREVTTTAR